MAHLSLFLLGGFQAALDGKPITGFESAKVRALLVYLAIETDRPHRREALAGLLWPDRPESSARNNLRHALAVLRNAIGDHAAAPPFLLIARETIQFNRDSDHIFDVEVLKNLVAASHDGHGAIGRLEHAASLYRGPFLEGFFLRDSPEFDDWSLIVRERVERQALAVLRGLAAEYEAQGQYVQACEAAHRQVELAPWQEEGHRQVMRLLALTGQRSAALAQYGVCRRALAAELNVEPAAETTALHARISDGLPAPTTQSLGAVQGHLRRAGTPLHNLPAPPTPLIGRETELAEVDRLLRDHDCRLLTLVGPGGIGKTHLALGAAVGLTAYSATRAGECGLFRDGTCFVPLAGVASAEAIVPAVAHAAGLSLLAGPDLRGMSSPKQQLLDYVRRRRLLLVLDNLEHLLDRSPSSGEDGASFVADVLATAPDVKVLVTSRASLDVPGEHLFPVPALDFPAERLDGRAFSSVAATLTSEGTARHSSVKLFLATARRAMGTFAPTDEDLAYIGETCYLVQGNPLGVLLAASWVEALTPAEIAAEVAGTFHSLRTDRRGVPERHRSMRGVLGHSWRLLTGQERAVAQALSAFRGGFTRQAAHYVAGASAGDLRSLINRSLVQQSRMAVTGGALGRRFEMHELLRQYAAERLDQSPVRRQAVHDRHSAYYVSALGAWGVDLKGPRQQEALEEMDFEIDNARAAWDWATEQGRVTDLARAAEGLGRYYEIRLRWQEGEIAFRTAAELLWANGDQEADRSGDAIRTMARVLAYQALFAQGTAKTEVAGGLLEQGLGLVSGPEVSGLDVRSEEAFVLYVLGRLGRRTGRFEIRQPYERSLALYRSCEDEWGIARVLCALGLIDNENGDVELARRRVEESATISRAIGDARGIAEATRWLSWVHAFAGELEEGERTAREAVASLRSLGDWAGVAEALMALASVRYWAGRYANGQAAVEERLAILQDLGIRDSFGLEGLAWVCAHQGRYQEANRYLDQALAIAGEVDALQLVADGLNQRGLIAVGEGAYVEARRLVEEALAMYRRLGLEQASEVSQSLLAHAARGMGDPRRARQHLAQAARTGVDRGALPSLAYSLPMAAVLLLDEGKTERALEAWESACCLPCVANSRWFEEVVGRPVATAAEALPQDIAAAARERGKAGGPQATLAGLLEELGA